MFYGDFCADKICFRISLFVVLNKENIPCLPSLGGHWTSCSFVNIFDKLSKESVKLTYAQLGSFKTLYYIDAKKGLGVLALHAAPVLWVILKGDSNNLFQMSVLQPWGTCSCYSHFNCPDAGQEAFQNGVDKQKPGVVWGFALLKLLQLKVGILVGRFLVLGIEPKALSILYCKLYHRITP